MSNPLVDQRAFASGDAYCVVPAAVLQVTGTDRHLLLDNLLSQRIRPLLVGDSREALSLTPEGRVDRVFHVVELPDATVLIAPGSEAADVMTWLDRRIFMEDVAVTEMPDVAVVTGRTHQDPAGALATWNDPWSELQSGGYQYSESVAPRDWDYSEWVIPADFVDTLTCVPASSMDALRVMAGRPALADVDATTLPHEFDWLRSAVHLNKGCYPGQETVAKVHNVGHPPRRVVRLHLDGSESVFASAGDDVVLDGVVVGRVTTAGLHFEEGPVALALVKRTTPTDATLTVVHDGVPVAATQEVIVPPTAGATAGVTRLPTLR